MNWWMRFGCFLTGYNPEIVKQASEATAKAVKRFTAALMIIGILWSLIGFIFAQKYLGLGTMGSLISALTSVVIIIQVERQIILQINPSRWVKGARIGLALIMAILGAVITDQILFADDIANQRDREIGAEVAEIVRSRSSLLDDELIQLRNSYDSLETSRQELLDELAEKPFVTLMNFSTEVATVPELVFDSVKKEMVQIQVPKTIKTPSTSSVANPKWEIEEGIRASQSAITGKMEKISERKLNLSTKVEEELKSRQGFLTELEALHALLFARPTSLVVWSLFFLFFLFLELLVLISKAGGEGTDYDDIVMHQQSVRKKALKDLVKQSIP